MFKRMATTAAFLISLFTLKEIPVVEGKVAFEDAHLDQLKKKMGDEKAQEIIDALNKELSDMAKDNSENEDLKAINQELEAIKKDVKELLDDTNLSEEEKEDLLKGKGSDVSVTAQLQALKSKQKEQNELLKKLINDPEGDSPLAIVQKQITDMKHSKTHLFATGKSWDAFDKRPWNQRLKDGSPVATDFRSDAHIPLLQEDVEHFVRENPKVLNSLFNDFAELPSQWSRRTGVLDRVASGTIIPSEVVQGRKKGWSPKGKFKITPEERRVYRKKIDITFDGFELQEIENTWINNYNKEGSHPWKMSFIGFLLSELVKQQKLDDRMAQINGIFAQTPEGEDLPGAAVNSQNGLRYIWWLKRDVEKKYRPFDIGEPTEANIVDYIDQMIELIPEVDRKKSGMEIQLSAKVLKWYRKKAGTVYQLHMSQDQGKVEYNLPHPIDYPNFLFQELKDQTKTNFIGICESKNVEILDYNVSEKGKFTITHDKRDTNIFADYRLGIGFQFVGTKLKANEPAEFERQVIWSNNVPVFDSSVTVPVFDDETGVLKVTYNNMKIDDAFKTDIEEVEGATAGHILRITGSTKLAAVKYVVNGDNILLTGGANFALNSGGTLTLYVRPDGKLKELSRTNTPAVAVASENEFDGAILDAEKGTEFHFTGAENTVLAEIINGVDGKTIKIYGVPGAVTLTVNTVAGEIVVDAAAVLATENDFLELIFVEGVWREVSRTIAAAA